MADEQLGQILELVKGIAGKQEASEARLAATEARLEDMAREVKERQPVMVKVEDFGEDPGEGLSLQEAEEMLERQRKYQGMCLDVVEEQRVLDLRWEGVAD